MPRWMAILYAAAALALGGFAARASLPKSAPQRANAVATADPAARDDRVVLKSVAHPRAALAKLESDANRPMPSPTPLVSESAPDRPGAQEHIRALERQAAEPEDPLWARRAENALLESYAHLLARDPELRLVDLRCRRTLCRVEWSGPADADADALHEVPWEGTSLFVQTPRDDGSSSIVAYIGRTGATLP